MTLNPDILTWARNTAGLSADEAARALGFNNTRRRSATERLMALEAGEEEPSRSVLLKMAKAYRGSLLVFGRWGVTEQKTHLSASTDIK
jgi:Helix-turn-helix domain